MPYAEEDWENQEHIEGLKNMEPDLLFSMQTQRSDGERPAKNVITIGTTLWYRRDLKRLAEDLVGLEEITASQEVDIVDDQDN